MHHCDDLIRLFNQLFQESEQTILVGYADEPLYLPKDENSEFHRVIFTKDYFASALHEIAHWCIAGKQRREEVDYGYWYYPDGRSSTQQKNFELVEVKPQALECLFSEAAGFRFRISQDNLNGEISPSDNTFEVKVKEQARLYRMSGMPKRARIFYDALERAYQLENNPA